MTQHVAKQESDVIFLSLLNTLYYIFSLNSFTAFHFNQLEVDKLSSVDVIEVSGLFYRQEYAVTSLVYSSVGQTSFAHFLSARSKIRYQDQYLDYLVIVCMLCHLINMLTDKMFLSINLNYCNYYSCRHVGFA